MKMIKRADGTTSKRGLWDNIRANAGSGKKPTAAMLKQEKIIKKKRLNEPNILEFFLILIVHHQFVITKCTITGRSPSPFNLSLQFIGFSVNDTILTRPYKNGRNSFVYKFD